MTAPTFPGADVATVETPSGYLVSVPADLVTPDVLKTAATVDATFTGDDNEKLTAFLTQMARRLASIRITQAQQTRLRDGEVEMVNRFRNARIARTRQSGDQIEAVIEHLATQVTYNGKAKSLNTPYGRIGTRATSGTIKRDAEDPIADLRFAAWALDNMQDVVRVDQLLPVPPHEYRVCSGWLRQLLAIEAGQARADFEARYAVALPKHADIVAHYKQTGELPDGYVHVPETVSGYVQPNGVAVIALEPMEIDDE